MKSSVFPLTHLIRQTAWLCASATIAASASQDAAHQALSRKAVAQSSMDKGFYFNAALSVHGGKLFKAQFSGCNHTGCTLLFEKLHSLRTGNCHLRTGMDMHLRKIPADKLEHTEILDNNSIQSRLIQWLQRIKKLLLNLAILKKRVYCKI